MKTIRMEEMTAPAINAAIAQGFTTVVVGVGSTEQHGPHLPTMTDTRIVEETAHRVALKLGNALQARTIPVGISDHHLAFGGTISLQPETLKRILIDYITSLSRCGFKRIVFLPSHGGNFATVEQAIKESQAAYPRVKITGFTDLLAFAHFLNSVSNEFGITADESGAHAGENETSIMMALESNLVLKDKFEPGYLGPTTEKEVRIILEKGMPALTQNGILGDPRKASAEKGEIYLEQLADFLVHEIAKQSID
jgi:creatinine amidohydrolase